MKKPPIVGDGIVAAPRKWSFGGQVHRVFDSHVRRSIPHYDELHELAVGFAHDFVRDGSEVRDLGCSTGALSARLAEAFPKAQILGIDLEPTMVETANRSRRSNLRYLCSDVRATELGEFDFAAMCYTLQFLPLVDRPLLLRNIHQGLRPGGALLVAEKVKRRNAEVEAACCRIHKAHKLTHGFSEAEILAKAQSLETVLIPLFEDENPTLLTNAGFSSVQLVFRHSCFDGWLARKRS